MYNDNNNGVFGRLKRTSSNRSLFKLSIKKSWNSSFQSVNNVPAVVTPPSPTQVAPLWKEQVDSNIKNGLNPSEIHRQEIMFEIIRTEKAFVEDVRYLIEYYVKSIHDSGIRLPPSLEETFTILPDIYLLHFNVSLQLLCIQAIMYPIVPSIAHILRDLATQFQMYESYLVHHKMAISEIANARKKNTKLGQLVKNLEAEIPPGPPGKILTLESLLSKPFQRLCKYPLLVMTLLRATSPDHKDHESLIDLHNQVDCALRELQERKSEYERSLESDDFPRKFGSFGRLNKFSPNGRNRTHSLPFSR
ncbi:Dbl homology domain-containing protein [Glomus cerebriforme]|uniref:Dbl homology domain-containing protein n=1 Tax=Glomus cerebriforme TaxID=658196 RepID=A0A397T376_9GLOM|nr:Dbl homology domain-containing protein [Glomus cerebriforme]